MPPLARKIAFRLVIVLGLTTFVLGCNRSETQILGAQTAFYYWRTAFEWNDSLARKTAKLGVKTLYVRMFDVVWNDQPEPNAVVEFQSPYPAGFELIPVVYITNGTMQAMDPKGMDALAKNILRKLFAMQNGRKLPRYREIQIDCDWTANTREKYFDLLKILRDSLNKEKIKLSATIRLHQIKFAEKTGVPPVDGGLLMYYNMGAPDKPDVSNAILDNELAENYAASIANYPLPLDYALPLFSWAARFEGETFKGLYNGWRTADLEKNGNFAREKGALFRCQKRTEVKGVTFAPEDRLRVDEVSTNDLKRAADYLNNRLPKADNRRLILYHLDLEILSHYANTDLQTLVSPNSL